jgi:hypothetical protein
MLRDIEGFEGGIAEFTKVFDCGINIFKLSELLKAMK